MTTWNQPSSEWDVPGLRPVARWVTEPDERGGTRLVMHWSVPEVVVPAVDGTAAAA